MSLSIFSQNGVELSHVDKLSSATTEASIEAGLALLDAETGWENVKTIHEKKTNHSVHITKLHPRKKSDRERDRGEKLTWFRRTSEHDPAIDLSYEEFRQGLTVNHATNEQEYIKDLERVERVKVLQDGKAEIWTMQYHIPFPAKNRDFAELQISHDLPVSESAAGPLRGFVFLQVPVMDVPESKSHVRGAYTSIERVQEVLSGDGSGKKTIVWTMATASSAGGALPQVSTDLAMPASIAHDVPQFIEWAKKRRSSGSVN